MTVHLYITRRDRIAETAVYATGGDDPKKMDKVDHLFNDFGLVTKKFNRENQEIVRRAFKNGVDSIVKFYNLDLDQIKKQKADKHRRVKKYSPEYPGFQFILSLQAGESKLVEQWLPIVTKFIDDIELAPVIVQLATRHGDTKLDHVHLVAICANQEGELLKTPFKKRKIKESIDLITREFSLKPNPHSDYLGSNEHYIDKEYSIKELFRNLVDDAISKSSSIEEFCANLKDISKIEFPKFINKLVKNERNLDLARIRKHVSEIEIRFRLDSAGNARGISFGMGGFASAGFRLGGNYTFLKIMKRLEEFRTSLLGTISEKLESDATGAAVNGRWLGLSPERNKGNKETLDTKGIKEVREELHADLFAYIFNRKEIVQSIQLETETKIRPNTEFENDTNDLIWLRKLAAHVHQMRQEQEKKDKQKRERRQAEQKDNGVELTPLNDSNDKQGDSLIQANADKSTALPVEPVLEDGTSNPAFFTLILKELSIEEYKNRKGVEPTPEIMDRIEYICEEDYKKLATQLDQGIGNRRIDEKDLNRFFITAIVEYKSKVGKDIETRIKECVEQENPKIIFEDQSEIVYSNFLKKAGLKPRSIPANDNTYTSSQKPEPPKESGKDNNEEEGLPRGLGR